MNRLAAVLRWLPVFILLDLYVNLVPRVAGFALPVWLTYVAGFFLLAYVLCRFGLGITRMQTVGLGRSPGWLSSLGLGFAIGFGVWALKNLLYFGMGKFDVVGWRDWSFVLPMLGQALVGMLLASAINDLMIRGYGLAFCRRFNLMAWYLLITTAVYALDDSWNEGIDPFNLLFSAVLGVSLAYTVLRTGAIWMSIGIHWGGNMCYRFMAGFDGQGVLRLEHVIEGARFEYAGLAVTALMFPLLVLVLRWFVDQKSPVPNSAAD